MASDANLDPADLERLLGEFNSAAKPLHDRRYRVNLEIAGGCLVLRLQGLVLQPIATEFGERLNMLFHHTVARRAIIDLSKCDFISSAALSLLVEFFAASSKVGGQVLLVKPNAKVANVIRLVGLDQFFLSVEDEDTARRYFEDSSRQAAPPAG